MIKDTGHRFLHAMLRKPDFLRINMVPDKSGAGHASNKHIDKTYIELIDRKFEKRRDGTELKACTNFPNYDILQQNVVTCILKNEDRISSFLDNSMDGDRMNFHAKIRSKNNWGTVVYENRKNGQLDSGLSDDMTVVLVKDEKRDLGFFIVTTYSDQNSIREKHNDLTPYIKQTKAWNRGSTFRKMNLWRMAEPDPCYTMGRTENGVIYIQDKASDLRCDFASNGTFVSKVDENGEPKKFGLRPNKKTPYDNIENKNPQDYLQKQHPAFYKAVIDLNRIYRECIPVKPKIPQKSNFERVKEQNKYLTDENLTKKRDSPCGD